MAKNDLAEAVGRTIKYADIFDFPLTDLELRRFLIEYKIDHQPIPVGNYEQYGKYLFLKGRGGIVSIRESRILPTQKKVARAARLARFLQFFPGVRMVALSGSVAANNAKDLDDIDILIVTAPGRIWLTRALIFLTTGLLGLKRTDRPGVYLGNQFCFNMWLTASKAGFMIEPRDLYAAYEIALMKPLVGGETYRKFLSANAWVKEYLPNFKPPDGEIFLQDRSLLVRVGRFVQGLLEIPLLWGLGRGLELLARAYSKNRINLKHRRGYKTSVKVSDDQLMFHPESPRSHILTTLGLPNT